jgi:hypothetical protein
MHPIWTSFSDLAAKKHSHQPKDSQGAGTPLVEATFFAAKELTGRALFSLKRSRKGEAQREKKERTFIEKQQNLIGFPILNHHPFWGTTIDGPPILY